jgi:hypothetical protein
MQKLTQRIAFAAMLAAGLALAVLALQPGVAEAQRDNKGLHCLPEPDGGVYCYDLTGSGNGGYQTPGTGGGNGGGGGGNGGGGGGTGGSGGGGGTASPTYPGHITPGPWNWRCDDLLASLVTGTTQCERDFDSWIEQLCELPENAGHRACGGREDARDWISEGGY